MQGNANMSTAGSQNQRSGQIFLGDAPSHQFNSPQVSEYKKKQFHTKTDVKQYAHLNQ